MEDKNKQDKPKQDKPKQQIIKMMLENKPIICDKCRGKLFFVGGGRYKCSDCGNEVLDDFGKVKEFLDKNGPANSMEIEENTGVRREIINQFLKKGRLEIPEGSSYYIKCEKCGCSIRYGRFCPECIQKLAGGLKVVFNEDMGERPKKEVKSGMSGKMHFFKGNNE